MTHRRRSYHRLLGVLSGLVVAGLCISGCASQSSARPVPRSAAPMASTPPSPAPSTTFVPPAIARTALRKQFAYPAATPTIKMLTSHISDGVTVESITYGPDATPAELVFAAKNKKRVPGIVYAHGGGTDPDAFLTEAIAIVHHGAVAILPDLPITMTGDAQTDLAFVTSAIVAERRALDVLVARPDVDAKRLAFVGHSWGAELADIMTGVEPRLSAVAIVCGWSRMSTDMLDAFHELSPAAPASTPAQTTAYLDVMTILDGFRYLAIPNKRQVLLQYGRQDPNIPQDQRTETTKSTVGKSTRKDYDAGHDLVNEPTAAADRLSFLLAALR